MPRQQALAAHDIEEPIPLPGRLDVSRVRVVPLGAGTLAQIVRGWDRYLLQVNDRVARGDRAAVVQHLVDAHETRCAVETCPVAATWLSVPVAPLVATIA